MEEDYLKKYQEAWQKDADDLLDKVAPPMEELLEAVERRERQRRSRRTAFISGIAAMLVLAVTFIFIGRNTHSTAPVVASNTTEQQTIGSDEGTTAPKTDVQPLPQQQPAIESDLAMAAPQPQVFPVPQTAAASASPVVPAPSEPALPPDSYAAQSNFDVAYLDEYYLDSFHTAPATVITAKDSAAWEWLSTQFATSSEIASSGNIQFIQRNYQLADKNNEPAGLDIDTGSYILSTLPADRAIVVIHYESVADLIDLLGNHPNNYAESDTQLLQSPHQPKAKMPKDHEKVPNRHNVRIKSPTYYQAITPNGRQPKGYHR